MDVETITALFNAKKSAHNIDFEPKTEQMQIAAHLRNGKNTLGFLPTGFGKTLTFVVNEMLSEENGITLIISPLMSLIDDQMKALDNWKFSCAKISPDTSTDVCKGIANGDFQFVLSSPESILKPIWRSTFLSPKWQKRLSLIIFDEAHCLSEWGEDFRPEYKQTTQLRSFFQVPILAVTATCTKAIKDDIISILHLKPQDTEILCKSANRDNILISCQKKTSTDVEIQFDWLINHLKRYSQKSNKILIYCRSIDAVSELFLSIKFSLGLHAYSDLQPDPKQLLIEMFHKCTHESSKSRIIQEFSKQNSVIRCVIATVALGMGIDIKDIDIVVHYGCPKSVISYWQEAGRCARDGRRGLSLILYDNVTASAKTTDKTMASIVRNSQQRCVRQGVLEVFAVVEQEIIQNKTCDGCEELSCSCTSCKCCSFCSLACKCSDKSRSILESFLTKP